MIAESFACIDKVGDSGRQLRPEEESFSYVVQVEDSKTSDSD
jgi:hypothetical protein